MADIKIAGASYSGVPRIDVPKTTSGTASFYECTGTKNITENGTFDVTGLASVLVNVAGGGGGLPSGISKIAFGTDTITSAFTTTKRTVTHNLGVIPDMVLYWYPDGNIATTYSMLFALRSSQLNFRSGYNSYYGYHGNSTSTVTVTNSSNANYGIGTLNSSTTFTVASHSTSYYWRAGTYNWMAIKFA